MPKQFTFDELYSKGARPSIEKTESSPETSFLDDLKTGSIGAAQGITQGFGDELYGAGKGLYDTVTKGDDLSTSYQNSRDEARKFLKDQEASNPTAYNVGNIGGTILPHALLAAATMGSSSAASAGTLTARMAAMAAKNPILYNTLYGAASGALGSVGQSEKSDIGDIATDAAKDAAVSGLTSGGVTAGLKGGAWTLDKAKGLFSGLAEDAGNALGSKAIGNLLTNKNIQNVSPERVSEAAKLALDKNLGANPNQGIFSKVWSGFQADPEILEQGSKQAAREAYAPIENILKDQSKLSAQGIVNDIDTSGITKAFKSSPYFQDLAENPTINRPLLSKINATLKDLEGVPRDAASVEKFLQNLNANTYNPMGTLPKGKEFIPTIKAPIKEALGKSADELDMFRKNLPGTSRGLIDEGKSRYGLSKILENASNRAELNEIKTANMIDGGNITGKMKNLLFAGELATGNAPLVVPTNWIANLKSDPMAQLGMAQKLRGLSTSLKTPMQTKIAEQLSRSANPAIQDYLRSERGLKDGEQ